MIKEQKSSKLMKDLKSGDPLKRREAVIAIGAEKCASLSANLLDILKDENECFSNKILALDSICKLNSANLIEELSHYIENNDVDPTIEFMVYFTLEQLLAIDPKQIEKKLSKPHSKTLSFYISEAGRLKRSKALPVLNNFLKKHVSSKDILIDTLESLSVIGDDSSIEGIHALLKHPDNFVICSAAYAMAKVGNKNSSQNLIEILGSDDLVNFAVIDALKSFGGGEAIKAIAGFMRSDNPTIRNHALDSLLLIGKDAAPFILHFLKSEDLDLKIMTLSFFSFLGEKSFINEITPLCADPNTNVRIAAFGVLEKIGMPPENVLLKGIQDVERDVRLSAMNVLEAFPDQKLIDKLIKDAEKNSDLSELLIESVITLSGVNLFLSFRKDIPLKNLLYKQLMNIRSEKTYREFRSKLVKAAPKEIYQEFDEIVCIDNSYVNKFHILLADDSRFILKAVSSKLQQMGFLVTTVENGLLAENFLDKNSGVDLIITDINMPKQNGIELIKRVRNKPDYLNIPIIVISTEEKEIDKAGAKAIGANDYIVKPINYSRLRSIIDNLIAEKKYKIKDSIFKDSRFFKRKEMDIPFFGTMGNGIVYGHSKNISLNGMELFTNSVVKDKSVFNIRFNIVIKGMKRSIKTDCMVRWITEGNIKGEHRAGIEFRGLEKRMYDLLEKFLNDS